MSKVSWIGNAAAVAQAWAIGIGIDDHATTYSITMNGKVVSVVGSGTGTADTASALQKALAASTFPEFAEVIWTVSSATITATAKVAGKPFTFARSVSGGTGSLAITSVVACTGPNFWSNPGNWSTGVVPTSGDDVYFENSSVDILYDIATSGVTLASLNIAANFTGSIGLPLYANATNPTTCYREYRPTELGVAATAVTVGYGSGACSGRIRLDLGGHDSTINVLNTGNATEPNLEALVLKGTGANTLNVLKGSVGVGVISGDAAALIALSVGWTTSRNSDSNVRIGGGVILNAVTQTGGSLVIYTTHGVTGLGLLSILGGTCTVFGDDDMSPDNSISGSGTLIWNSTGHVNTTIVFDGTLDFSKDMAAKTGIGSAPGPVISLFKGATYNDPLGVVTNVQLATQYCLIGQGGVTVNLPVNASAQTIGR